MAAKKITNILEDLIDTVRDLLDGDDKYSEFNTYLNDIKRGRTENKFGSDEILVKAANAILDNKSKKTPMEMIRDAEIIFDTVVPIKENNNNAELEKTIFLKIFEKDGIYFSGLYSEKIYLSFSDKILYIETMCAVSEIPGIAEKINAVGEYAAAARQFFTDERAFSSAFINGAAKIVRAEDPVSETEKLLDIARRSAGIYDISEESISAAELQLKNSKNLLSDIEHTLDITEKRIEILKNTAETSGSEIKDIALRETENMRREAKNAELGLRQAYDAFLKEEHDGIIFEKDKLVREIIDSADGKIRELKMIAESIKNNTSAELFRINTEANKAVDRAAAMLQSGELKSMISQLEKNDGLVEKIIRVDEFSRKFEPSKTPSVVHITSDTPAPKTKTINSISEKYSAPADETVNIYFNEGVPFKKRFAKLCEMKQRDIVENGTIYHERFDDVLTAVIEDSNPYLIGPSGCGKTFLVGQIAALLGLEYLDIGYINEEYDIIGFQTADGGYNYPAFYRAYKYGGIVFCDEFDNGNSRAAVKLNSFMTNGKNASYCFPNGERVKRHPNFRIIAAGNTAGGGADRNYSTREKIEESLQQRFTAMYVDYDNRLEEEILKNYPEWFEFAVNFRKATDAWSKANETAAAGIFTTRDAASIKKYLDHESYDAEAIISYEFIETKDNDYLAFLQREMNKFYASGEHISSGLFSIFSSSVDRIRKGGARR